MGSAAAVKLGRRPVRQSPRSVNWLTTRIAPRDVKDAEVHLTVVVLEPSQVEHLVGHPGGIGLGVAVSDAEEDEPTPLDAADVGSSDLDRGSADALQHCAHCRDSPRQRLLSNWFHHNA